MARRLDGQVVVITGASSGIGRAAAQTFAAQGAAVVLAARREPLLHEVASEVIDAGGRAMSVPVDVRRREDMERLAQRAVEGFGRIDVWINNAGVATFGRFEDTPDEALQAVLDTTFMGVVNGFRAVLPHFRRQGHGIVINTASVASRLPAPYHAMYGAAKHALIGFTEAVREELRQDGGHDIHICNVLPGPVDTPFWQHAGNYSGREIQAMQPASSADEVADVMVRLALRPRREVGVGAPPWMLELGMAIGSGAIERIMGRQVRRGILSGRPQRHTEGALRRPMPEGGGVSGGWRPEGRQRTHGANGTGVLTGAMALAVPIGLAALYRYRTRGHVL